MRKVVDGGTDTGPRPVAITMVTAAAAASSAIKRAIRGPLR